MTTEKNTSGDNTATDVTHHSVTEDEAGVRLDRWVVARFPALSHNHVSKLLRKGQIRVDGKRAEGNDRVAAWQSVRMPPLGEYAVARPKNERRTVGALRTKQLLDYVIYEDDDVVAINKPAGLAVQGGTGIKRSLDDELLAFANSDETPKLVHRLDRDTSGVLLIARNAFAARALTAAFRTRDTQKYYLALVAGTPPEESGTIKAPLLKRSDGRVMVIEEGQSAASDFYVIDQAFNKAAALLLHPMTGRTHQLRVHCEFMGCPIIGDPLYQNDKSKLVTDEVNASTLQLHAYQLIIPHPRRGQKPLNITAPLPKNQSDIWKLLGFNTKINVKNILAG